MRDQHKVLYDFFAFSETYGEMIDSFIKDYYADKTDNALYPFQKKMYTDIAGYCTREGKRIRPLLVLVSYLGYKRRFHNIPAVVELAATLEIMHSMLLVQDDIVDRSLLRRGLKSLHVLYNEEFKTKSGNENIGADIAIIIADVMFSNCLEIISNNKLSQKIKNRFLDYFSRTYEKTAWGQILDIINSNTGDVDYKNKTAEQISEMKTAYYTLYFPLLMGYSLTGYADEQEMNALKEFALPLGMAFQIRDDMLGVFGKEAETGKSTDSDIEEGKKTLLIQYTLSLLKPADRKRFLMLFNKKKKNKTDVKSLKQLILQSKAPEQTLARHSDLIEQSLSALDRMAISGTCRSVLLGIAEKIRDIPADLD